MEVTRQLRLDALTKKGLAPIQLTFCWDRLRLRLGSGETCDPKHWNPKREEVKPVPGNFAAATNLVLERYTQAAQAAERAAQETRTLLPKEQMLAEIKRRYQLLTAGDEAQAESPEVAPLPVVEAAPPTFLEYYDQWLGEQTRKTSHKTGQGLSKSYLDSLANTRAVLEDFAGRDTQPLAFPAVDHAWYARFREFFYQGSWGTSVNTFGKHVRHLKSFLAWAEDRELPVNRKYRKFEAPDEYIGADALTQAELLRLAAVDFHTAEARAYVQQQFEQLDPALQAQAATKKGMRVSQADPRRVAERLRMLERSRDKVLLCCYLGLRISDADKLSPRQLHGDLVKLKATKTRKDCYIPYFDDDVFRPVALVQKYAALHLATCLPVVNGLSDYLPHVQHLAGLTRFKLTSKIGRKTFVTLKISQGVPRAQVMQATGHRTESSFNRYLGVVEEELLATFRKTARTVDKAAAEKRSDAA
ncbi:phage integrase SAM-like domain-containing protein [Hymenobacter sp. BT683]|uniref:Phage integrase SAM-like domain-containing protein n=1 Tax=Hymenobacter jeongseonensis TaxID=2791027 RepID=A0ABS0IMC0_9BACT|nr:phage integrase SAM-like domain-containing protein [Hymenobacter jeongseonensis]MBF9239505.1 phage integrase SAM-like domain-containing protein [Hymenobacter jeongseonensis]